MALGLNHMNIATPIEQMLQGISCLMAYKDCIQNRDSYEAEFVIAACEILQSQLGRKDYSVFLEYPYRYIIGGNTRQEADLVIIKKGNNKEEKGVVLCVMEFKMSTDTNGGVDKDINKLRTLPKSIDRLSILLFLKPNEDIRPRFVTDLYNAKKERIELDKNKYLSQETNVCVRKVAKVFRTKKSVRPPYMAVCIAVM